MENDYAWAELGKQINREVMEEREVTLKSEVRKVGRIGRVRLNRSLEVNELLLTNNDAPVPCSLAQAALVSLLVQKGGN